MGKAVRTADEGLDFYPTPPWATKIILPYLKTPSVLLEPAVGDSRMLGPILERWPRATSLSMDIQDVQSLADHHAKGDFLQVPRGFFEADLVITNPPYCLNKFAEFARACIQQLAPGGQVALLVPSGFLGSKRRLPFHRTYPGDIYWLPRRPSFTGSGNAGTEYIWWVHTDGQTESRNFWLEED